MDFHRYLLACDGSLAKSDLIRVCRFLDDVFAAQPPSSLEFVGRFPPSTALASSPLFGLDLAPAPIGPTNFARYCSLPAVSLRAGRRTIESGVGAGATSRCLVPREQVWGLLRRWMKRTGAPDRLREHSGGLAGALTRSACDAILCVSPIRRATGSIGDSLVCQLARWATAPVWCCPREYAGIARVVLASPDATAPAHCESAASQIAAALGVSLVRVHAAPRQERGERGAADVLNCEHCEEVGSLLRADDLLVMGAYGRPWYSRWFRRSRTERILARVHGPALLLPGRAAFRCESSPVPDDVGSPCVAPFDVSLDLL